jgi:hypothetical protein
MNHLIFNTLNSFSINPENDCYQQRRSKDDNEKEPIFLLHGITGGRHFIKAKLSAYTGRSKFGD